jgi:L-serine dehydratase
MESISVLDMFKIGVGPSSSHTLGPWKAAVRFMNRLGSRLERVERIEVQLFGSLAKTGKGHGTDTAIQLGLSGEDPVLFDPGEIDITIQNIQNNGWLLLNGVHKVEFNPDEHIRFLGDEMKEFHPNALTFLCTLDDATLVKETYYSVGGGFVVKEGEEDRSETDDVPLPYPINSAAELDKWCKQTGLPISGVVAENENGWRSEEETRKEVLKIWDTMRGVSTAAATPTDIYRAGCR